MNERQITQEPYRFGYQGQYAEKDSTSGWNMFDLRMYDARIGRWLSGDPYGQFDSPYVGMGNNPTTGTDPDGGLCCGNAFVADALANKELMAAAQLGAARSGASLFPTLEQVTGTAVGATAMRSLGGFTADNRIYSGSYGPQVGPSYASYESHISYIQQRIQDVYNPRGPAISFDAEYAQRPPFIENYVDVTVSFPKSRSNQKDKLLNLGTYEKESIFRDTDRVNFKTV